MTSIFELTTNIPSVDSSLKQITDANKLHIARLLYNTIYHISTMISEYRTQYTINYDDIFDSLNMSHIEDIFKSNNLDTSHELYEFYMNTFSYILKKNIYKCFKFKNPNDKKTKQTLSESSAYADICGDDSFDYDDEYNFINNVFKSIENENIPKLLKYLAQKVYNEFFNLL